MVLENWTSVLNAYKEKLGARGYDKTSVDRFFDELQSRMMDELHKPTHIAVIGKTGVGKTSTINALFGTDWKVSHTRAATKQEQVFLYTGERGTLKISDLPGFGEDIETEQSHLEMCRRVLRECDVALLILKADSRDMADVQRMLKQLTRGATRDAFRRLVVGLNQVDVVQPGRWLDGPNVPSSDQVVSIKTIVRERTRSIRKVCPINAVQVVAYSAARRYRLVQLFEVMIRSTAGLPWVLDAKKSIADYLELIERQYLPEKS